MTYSDPSFDIKLIGQFLNCCMPRIMSFKHIHVHANMMTKRLFIIDIDPITNHIFFIKQRCYCANCTFDVFHQIREHLQSGK